MKEPERIYRKDYRTPPFRIPKTELEFDLDPHKTIVSSRLSLECDREGEPLVLNGESIKLIKLSLEGEELSPSDYEIQDDRLIISKSLPNQCQLNIVTEIDPSQNFKLMGLYQSDDILCTQMEAEGFRRVTYFLDRPDVLSRFTTKVIGDKKNYPMLLSNGNPIERGDLPAGKHYVIWEDPFPKPCYLFALVAGDLGKVEGDFTTMSGRSIKCEVYVDHGNEDRAEHALVSLHKSMKWDEETFGLEYDLDRYMIVAVDAFNFGAMENKGLNIFNSSAVLANTKSATDKDYQRIEGIVAHEYFHNWTGNRVTCRDWFQLTLKEGLTVFRDQEFSACMHSAPVCRIGEVRSLREMQFAEDSGPNSHPIRPDSYIEINNFYTSTIYEKGAEVIRMIHTIVGETGFRKGMDLYFERHDGQAVCTNDFVAAMADANGVDLKQFESSWYSQKGTPMVQVSWQRTGETLALTLTQNPPVQDDEPGVIYDIPVRTAVLDGQGGELEFEYEGELCRETVLRLTQKTQSFEFKSLQPDCIPSVFRQFSAPVKVQLEEDYAYLLKRLQFETDAFNAYEAGQVLMLDDILRMYDEDSLSPNKALVHALIEVLDKPHMDDAMKAEMLSFPSLSYILESTPVYDPESIQPYLNRLKKSLAEAGRDKFLEMYQQKHREEKSEMDTAAMGRRALKNKCLYYLSLLNEPELEKLVEQQYHEAKSMTDKMGALVALVDGPKTSTASVLADFETTWNNDPVVMNKWFAIQASSDREDLFDHIARLKTHSCFDPKNPNKLRALYGSFMRNLEYFHHSSGRGYEILAEAIIDIDKFNSGAAAGLSRGFSRLKKLPKNLQVKMKAQIDLVLSVKGLSRDTYEILSQTVATIAS
jgi:aminopeptidase N